MNDNAIVCKYGYRHWIPRLDEAHVVVFYHDWPRHDSRKKAACAVSFHGLLKIRYGVGVSFSVRGLDGFFAQALKGSVNYTLECQL